MCRYYSDHFYSLCAHTVSATPLPLARCVLLAECAAQQAARQAAAAALPARATTRSDASLNNWRAQLHRSDNSDDSSTTTTTNPRPHPCFVVDFVPGTLWTLPESAADPLQTLCPACRAALRQFDARWARMLAYLVAASDAAAAGAFRTPRPTALSAAGLALPEPWPAVLQHLPGSARRNRVYMEQARTRALAQRGAYSVFRGGLWGELCAFERMLLAHFVFGRTALPHWEDYDTAWGLEEADAEQAMQGLRVVLSEGERRLEALPEADAAPNGETTTAEAASDEGGDFWGMDM